MASIQYAFLNDTQIGAPMPCVRNAVVVRSEHIADMPHWMGGLPDDAPPRCGSPEYDEFMAKRAQEAARPKAGQQQPK